MTSVKPLYDAVRATVLDGLRREWQRYGWEDSEIDDKVEKLGKLWATALHNTGAVTDAPQRTDTATDEEKDEGSVDGKRKRKREDRPGEKRFKTGPRVDAPLTYPTFPPTASAATSAQPAALPSGYVPRFSSPSPSPSPQPPPQPPSAATAPPLPRNTPPTAASEPTEQSGRVAQEMSFNVAMAQQLRHTQPSSALAKAAVPDEAEAAAPSISPGLSVKAEMSLPPLPLIQFSASSSVDNPLLTEPLSSLDDDSDVDVELGSVKDLILCQYERVQHQKGRWKVVMRDGIVSVKGKEYAFSRLTGELQW